MNRNINKHAIPLDEYKRGFKVWKEVTTKSPSICYLGRHHALLDPDGFHHKKDKETFCERMWRLYHNIITTALLNGSPLKRLLTSIVILLPKDKEKVKVRSIFVS